MGMMRNAYNISVGKPVWKGPLEDLRLGKRIILKWMLNLREIAKCIKLAGDRVQWQVIMNTVMNLRVP
jgi:hypothetical protein